LGWGSSLASDCSMRRRGSPASLQLLRAALASRLNQVSSKKPTTHSGRPSDRRINRSRRLFSCILRIWGSDPPLGPLPAHSQWHHKVARTLWPVICSLVRPSSKLTKAARSSVHRLVSLAKFLWVCGAKAPARARPVRDPAEGRMNGMRPFLEPCAEVPLEVRCG
jgi:hypothetical protein